MKIETITGQTCTACDACMNICPKQAISIVEDKYGFYEPKINHNDCINCGLCDKSCPELNLTGEKLSYEAYCGYVTKEEIRSKSSSGGIFRALADSIIASGGVVFGAAFNYGDYDFRLEHMNSDEIGIELLQKSKYVQSYVGLTYRKVKEQLQSGRKVLFVGTPCQVAGLKSYLGKYVPDNLLTVDFICHGVPSMHFLKDHLQHIGFHKLSEINKIDFRPKVRAWVDDIIVESSSKHYQRFYIYDSYFKGFMQYTTIRSSCFNCNYCNGLNRKADITLADFWGFPKTDIKIDDWRQGLSLVLAYNYKGLKILKSLKDIVLKPVDTADTEYVYMRNRTTEYPHEARQKFFEDYAKKGYNYAIENNGLSISWKEIMVHKAKQSLKKLLSRFL